MFSLSVKYELSLDNKYPLFLKNIVRFEESHCWENGVYMSLLIFSAA
jgi:hypothetical protein